MQHAGPNARRAGVGLLHVASETAESSGGGVGVGVGCWGVAIIVVVMLMMANWRCCEGVAGSGERARLEFACGTRRIVPRKARRGSGWPGWRWWAVGGGVGGR